MALIVETGDGVVNANGYVSVAYFDSYFTARGNTEAVALSTPEKEAAIVRATDYIELRWSERFKGVRAVIGQALSFPRFYTDYAGMPPQLLKATCEYALRSVDAPLAPDLTIDEYGRMATKKVEKVGPIVEETTWAARGTQSKPLTFRPYPVPDNLISQLLIQLGVYR